MEYRIIGFSLRGKKRNDEIRKVLEVFVITAKARENRFRWFGHLHKAVDGKPANDILSTVVKAGGDRERDGNIISKEISRN